MQILICIRTHWIESSGNFAAEPRGSGLSKSSSSRPSLESQRFQGLRRQRGRNQPLCSFATDATRELNILWHDGHTLGVDGAQVGVFEQANKVRFGGFLERQDGRALEAQVRFVVLRDFTHQALERQLADQQVRRLLVLADFTQRDGTWTVAMRLLDATGGRRALTRGLRGELFARCLATGGLTGSLLGTGHAEAVCGGLAVCCWNWKLGMGRSLPRRPLNQRWELAPTPVVCGGRSAER
ncbi:TPA: hypothetical protein N0F65_006780 [Lagenidium giganteum]|uniref:Uncharacterized protein n=1 Tax=Lagenidium giganteum TaxID=4803 RepID=A0AAV2ZBC5_9STRA|nr:TPA: hypothetical protein N0F65_006780 [Lagenidium giganteum]